MPTVHPNQLIQRLWPSNDAKPDARLYAILDGARDERIYRGLTDASSEYICLYRGELAQALLEVSPYLVALEPDATFTHWLISLGWGHSWGIFLESSASMQDLRRHFRRFLMVYDEDGKPLYFRYYDPRVLRTYLPTCNASELEIVFGPVDAYRMEDAEGEGLMTYTRNGDRLIEHRELLP